MCCSPLGLIHAVVAVAAARDGKPTTLTCSRSPPLSLFSAVIPTCARTRERESEMYAAFSSFAHWLGIAAFHSTSNFHTKQYGGRSIQLVYSHQDSRFRAYKQGVRIVQTIRSRMGCPRTIFLFLARNHVSPKFMGHAEWQKIKGGLHFNPSSLVTRRTRLVRLHVCMSLAVGCCEHHDKKYTYTSPRPPPNTH